MADFSESVTGILVGQPFFGQLLMKLRHIPNEHIPTACISRRGLEYNPVFFESLSTDVGLAAATHELLHAMFRHLDDIERYATSKIGPDGKEFNPLKFNVALDYIVNDIIKENNIGKLGEDWYWSKDFPHTMTPDEVYRKMKDDELKQNQDSHDFSPVDGASPEDLSEITPVDILQAYKVSKTIGRVPAGLDRIIGEITRPKRNPWSVLRKTVINAFRQGHDAVSWKRLQRQLIVRGIGAPSKAPNGVDDIGIVIDTSGSIDVETLTLFACHMAAIVDTVNPKLIRGYWCDNAVNGKFKVKSGIELRREVSKGAKGGGGTDMRVGISAALSDRCSIIVVLTDMYTPFPTSCPVPLVWGATENIVAPVGTTVRLKN